MKNAYFYLIKTVPQAKCTFTAEVTKNKPLGFFKWNEKKEENKKLGVKITTELSVYICLVVFSSSISFQKHSQGNSTILYIKRTKREFSGDCCCWWTCFISVSQHCRCRHNTHSFIDTGGFDWVIRFKLPDKDVNIKTSIGIICEDEKSDDFFDIQSIRYSSMDCHCMSSYFVNVTMEIPIHLTITVK